MVRMGPAVKRAIVAIPDDGWETIHYTDAIIDETTGVLVSRAEVAETWFTAFSSRKKSERIPGRLVMRRISDLTPKATQGQLPLFGQSGFPAFFTTAAPAP